MLDFIGQTPHGVVAELGGLVAELGRFAPDLRRFVAEGAGAPAKPLGDAAQSSGDRIADAVGGLTRARRGATADALQPMLEGA